MSGVSSKDKTTEGVADKPSVLVVDDDPTLLKVLSRILEKEDYIVYAVSSGKSVFEDELLTKVDVVLLDLVLGKESGLDVLDRIREESPEVVVIMLTGFGDIPTAVEAIKRGAFQYIEKPCEVDVLTDILESVTYRSDIVDGRGLKKVSIDLGSKKEYFCYGAEMEDLIQLSRKAALGGDSTILIEGASGTGKELLSRYIHGLSSRRERPFVAINCGALPKDLMESELFGYESGAFTGARTKGKRGLVQQAEGGTLLLDEIGELPLALQTKLLRFLETKEYYQLGGVELLTSDIRIMASTNINLIEACKNGLFRKDLYYRLNVISIKLPTLLERRNDILPLSEHFLDHFSRRYNKNFSGFKDNAIKFLTSFPWDGNVRELRNMVERAVIIGSGNIILMSDLDPQSSIDRIDRLHLDVDIDLEMSPNPLGEARQSVIMRVLELTAGNKSKAAKLLKIPRSTLRFYLEKGIEED